ncbi:MAG TPA: DUF1579 family protein [Coriobacteriia bacterium]|nr:DUF1579 family protein [Coriobacteriia bacterium]
MGQRTESSAHAAGPELQPLEAFVGEWKTDGAIRASGARAAATMDAHDVYEWIPGGYFLLHRWDAHLPDGDTQGVEVIGLDRSTGLFFMRSFDSEGNAGEMQASASGVNWTFTSESLRFTGGVRDNGDTFSGLWELRSEEGAAWVPWMDITLHKVT